MLKGKKTIISIALSLLNNCRAMDMELFKISSNQSNKSNYNNNNMTINNEEPITTEDIKELTNNKNDQYNQNNIVKKIKKMSKPAKPTTITQLFENLHFKNKNINGKKLSYYFKKLKIDKLK